MIKMKYKVILGILLLMGMVNATFNCTVLGGDCSVETKTYMNQNYSGTMYYNTSVNVTISGNDAADTGLCNISCITNKTHGNFTNSTGSVVNMSWCNLVIDIISGSDNEAFPLNATEFVSNQTDLCNGSFAIWLNGTTNITVRIRASQARADEDYFPLIPVAGSASLLIAAILIRRWYKRRSS